MKVKICYKFSDLRPALPGVFRHLYRQLPQDPIARCCARSFSGLRLTQYRQILLVEGDRLRPTAILD
ncbi:MAG: hypothetical protein AB4352_08230 [Hormoscilla sp.]